MKSTENHNCRQVQDLLEAFLDDTLSGDEKKRVESHVHICTECQNELQIAEQVTQVLRTLPAKPCPPHVSDAVIASAQEERDGLRQRFAQGWLDLKPRLHWRPIFATAVIAVLAIFATLTLERREPHYPPITPEELARVELDVKWTLAYLGHLSQKTGLSVRDKVIEPEIVAPIQRALRTVMAREANK